MEVILRALVSECGMPKVQRALDQIREASGALSERESRTSDRCPESPTSDRPKPKVTRHSAFTYVEKSEFSEETRGPLAMVARKYDDKSFLPTLAEVKNFHLVYGINTPSPPASRTIAIPRIFNFLSKWEPKDIQALIESGAFSGPAQLAPIAAAIERSSHRRGIFAEPDQRRDIALHPNAWHSVLHDVYHNHPDCPEGKRIRGENRCSGTGNRSLCPQCADLNSRHLSGSAFARAATAVRTDGEAAYPQRRTMADRIGMSTEPEKRIAYWRAKEGHTDSRVLATNLTYDEALALERREANRCGCRREAAGAHKPGPIWSVFHVWGGRIPR